MYSDTIDNKSKHNAIEDLRSNVRKARWVMYMIISVDLKDHSGFRR